ncbi:ATP-binding protein, partial [Klebsiella oxytoca]
KLCPVRLGTSKQNKHTTLITGDSGFGKSVLLNVLNEITITSAQTALPFIGIVDKGFSAQGLIQMIRDALPAHRKDEAVGIILQNHEDFCRNPFDVQLGARKPVIPEKEWLLNLLYALCIDPTTGEAPNARDTRQILNRITDEAYRATAET